MQWRILHLHRLQMETNTTQSEQPARQPNDLPSHTASNGPNFIMYMTRKYNQSLIQTYDFAWAGAPTLGVKNQVNTAFMPNYVKGKPLDPGWDPKTTLFPIFVGINDLDHWNNAKNPPLYRNGVFSLYAESLRTVSTLSNSRDIMGVPKS